MKTLLNNCFWDFFSKNIEYDCQARFSFYMYLGEDIYTIIIYIHIYNTYNIYNIYILYIIYIYIYVYNYCVYISYMLYIKQSNAEHYLI